MLVTMNDKFGFSFQVGYVLRGKTPVKTINLEN